MKEKAKFVKKIMVAKKAAPRIDRCHSRLTPARRTIGIWIRNNAMSGISSQKIIAAAKMEQT
jgi:hypothetical protein